MFAPDTIAWSPQECFVVARDIPAIDRTSALLKYLRDEAQLAVDPIEMYDGSHESEMACGCEVTVEFVPQKVGRLRALRTGERAAPVAEFSRSCCDDHMHVPWSDDFEGFEGQLAAWTHDPRRGDRFEYEE